MSKSNKPEKSVKMNLEEPLLSDSVTGNSTSESDSDVIEKPKKVETRGRKKIPEELKKKSPKVDGRTNKPFVMTEARRAVFEKGQAILKAKNEAKRLAKEEEKKKYDEWKKHLQDKRDAREQRREKRDMETLKKEAEKDLDESSDEEIIVKKKKPKKKKVIYMTDDSDSDDNRKKNVIIINNGNTEANKKPVPRPVPVGVFC
jgi:hypothetical protein